MGVLNHPLTSERYFTRGKVIWGSRYGSLSSHQGQCPDLIVAIIRILEKKIGAGRFRTDLFYQLSAFLITR